MNKRILSLLHSYFEDLELWYPILRLREEGMTVELAGEAAGQEYIGKYGVPATADCSYSEANPENYDALLIPGGWAPDKLRRYPEVLNLVKHFDQKKKPIGIICHAGWVLISADILKGRRATSTPGIRDDMRNAGAEWVDEPVVVDDNIISSRRPPDLPEYMKAFIRILQDK